MYSGSSPHRDHAAEQITTARDQQVFSDSAYTVPAGSWRRSIASVEKGGVDHQPDAQHHTVSFVMLCIRTAQWGHPSRFARTFGPGRRFKRRGSRRTPIRSTRCPPSTSPGSTTASRDFLTNPLNAIAVLNAILGVASCTRPTAPRRRRSQLQGVYQDHSTYYASRCRHPPLLIPGEGRTDHRRVLRDHTRPVRAGAGRRPVTTGRLIPARPIPRPFYFHRCGRLRTWWRPYRSRSTTCCPTIAWLGLPAPR